MIFMLAHVNEAFFGIVQYTLFCILKITPTKRQDTDMVNKKILWFMAFVMYNLWTIAPATLKSLAHVVMEMQAKIYA